MSEIRLTNDRANVARNEPSEVPAAFGSPRSTHGEKGADKSPVKEYGDVGYDTNCPRDLAAYDDRKSTDPNADDPDGRRYPHEREIFQKERHIVRVRQ